MKNDVIKELNTFLEGNFMAVHAYENYIQHVDDDEIKRVLQIIQQNHKKHAMLIAERIQNLDGVPVEDVGLMGNVAEFLNKIKGSTTDPDAILKDALVGERRGIEKSKELLDGELDPESLKVATHILNADQKHVDLLTRFFD